MTHKIDATGAVNVLIDADKLKICACERCAAIGERLDDAINAERDNTSPTNFARILSLHVGFHVGTMANVEMPREAWMDLYWCMKDGFDAGVQAGAMIEAEGHTKQ